MAVNTRTEYAIRALLELMEPQGSPVSAHRICQHQQLPKKYVEHLLSSLKGAGLIISSAGSRGGYVLSRDPARISLLDVMQAVEDSTLELSCNLDGKYCLGRECGLEPLFSELAEKQRELFDSYSLKQIHQIQTKDRS